MSSEEIAKRLGRRLRAHRMRADVSQEGLADRAGVHRTEIGRLEAGGRVPRIDTLLRLAAALAIEPGDLLRGIHSEPPEGMHLSVDPLSSKDRAANLEVGLLTIVFGLHPEHLSEEGLIRRALAADPHSTEEEEIEQALARLKATELLREVDGLIVPTAAALHFDELPF